MFTNYFGNYFANWFGDSEDEEPPAVGGHLEGGSGPSFYPVTIGMVQARPEPQRNAVMDMLVHAYGSGLIR